MLFHGPRGTPRGHYMEDWGMPESSAISRNSDPFDGLLRKEPVTASEWIEIIEYYRLIIDPLLNRLTLPRLKDAFWAMKTNERCDVQQKMASMNVFQEKLNRAFRAECDHSVLSTQCIFGIRSFSQVFGDIYSQGSGVANMWGLTRSGRWIWVTVAFERRFGGFSPGKLPRYWKYRVSGICSSTCDLERLFMESPGFKPWEVLRGLLDFLEASKQRRSLDICDIDMALNLIYPVRQMLLQLNPEARTTL